MFRAISDPLCYPKFVIFFCLILHGVKICKYILETNIMKWALAILIVLIVLIVNMADSEDGGKNKFTVFIIFNISV